MTIANRVIVKFRDLNNKFCLFFCYNISVLGLHYLSS